MKLDGAWTLYYAPESDDMPMCPDQIAGSGMACITAQVPGNIEIDLMRAGLEQNPFYGENLYNFRKYEYYHWWYQKEFGLPNSFAGEQMELTLHGVNTIAEVFVNDTLVGKCDDMMIEHRFRVEKALRPGDFNTISVHILSAMNYARELESPVVVSGEEHTDELSLLRMPPHSFGWDIMPRLLSAGLWRSVSLDIVNPTRITQSYYATISASEEEAELMIKCRFTTPERVMQGYRLHVQGACGNSVFEYDAPARFVSEEGRVKIKNPKLWWPRGYGEQNLYTVKMELLHNGEVVDVRMERIGIRRFHIDHVMKPLDEGEFKVRCNGVPILCKGSNWVPLDAFHSRDAERLPEALRLLDEAGCNAVRCWGGNVYEDTPFFDFCDEHGILVWQDFAMGCALYPVWDEGLRENLRREALSVVRKLRHHPSLCLWAGDNECDLFWMMCYPFRRNPAENTLTRELLRDVLRAEDFTRPYLPSSPYVDEVAFARGAQGTSEDHLWGPRDYFKGEFYRTAPCHFASETGYHGCPDPASLREYIPEDQLWPIYNEGTAEDPFRGTPNPAWLAHQTSMELNETNTFGYRIGLMTSQVRHMFRDVPDSIDTYARMSQMSQAEAFKYFIERFRTAKWNKTGIIWWNVLDGWQQVSDAVVNYNFRPKLAYSFIRRAQEPVLMAFSDPQQDGRYDLHAVNDTQTAVVLTYEVRDLCGAASQDAAPLLLSGTVTVPADGNTVAARLDLTGRLDHVLHIRWTDADGNTHTSHYIAEPKHLEYRPYADALRLCGFDCFAGF